jgi:Fe-S-cluster containining protein
LEFMYLLKSVITKSDMETYGKVQNKVTKLLKDRAKVKDGEKFLYECPFLIDKKCCAYPYRGLICRTHGLAFFIDNSKKLKVPACVDLGLNYSEVYDKKSQMLLTEKFKSCGFKKEPVAYNISLKELMKTELVEALELDFGETKPLIDWFIK